MRASLGKKLFVVSYYLLLLFLPTQFGKHFWPQFSYIGGFRIDYLSPTLYFSDILLLIVFFIFIWQKESLISFFKQKLISPFTIFLLLFLVEVVTGIFLSQNILEGIYGFIKLIEFIAFGLITAKVLRSSRHTVLVTVLSISALFESILALAQFINQSSFGGLFYFLGERFITSSTPGAANASLNGVLLLRPYGTFSHPNTLAGYLIILSVIFLYFEGFDTRFLRLFKIVLLLLCTCAIFVALSRIVIVCWIINISLYIYLNSKNKYIPKKAYFLTLLTILIFIFTYFSMFRFRFSELAFGSETVQQRIMLLQNAIQMLKDHMLLGVGLQNFLLELPKYQHRISFSTLQPVHNIILLAACEIGILGLLFCVYFFVQTYKLLIDMRKSNSRHLINPNSVLIAISTLLVLGQTDHYFITLQQGQLLFALVLGLAWSIRKL